MSRIKNVLQLACITAVRKSKMGRTILAVYQFGVLHCCIQCLFPTGLDKEYR